MGHQLAVVVMPLVRGYEPTFEQMIMLRALAPAARYLIIRANPWSPVKAILPVSAHDGPGLNHLLHDARRRGEHCQLVCYRPDEEDLGPFEPNPWPLRLFVLALLALTVLAVWNAWRLWH